MGIIYVSFGEPAMTDTGCIYSYDIVTFLYSDLLFVISFNRSYLNH